VGGGDATDNADCAQKDEGDPESQEPPPGAADFVDTGKQWVSNPLICRHTFLLVPEFNALVYANPLPGKTTGTLGCCRRYKSRKSGVRAVIGEISPFGAEPDPSESCPHDRITIPTAKEAVPK
jgi:hypothetical protein